MQKFHVFPFPVLCPWQILSSAKTSLNCSSLSPQKCFPAEIHCRSTPKHIQSSMQANYNYYAVPMYAIKVDERLFPKEAACPGADTGLLFHQAAATLCHVKS